MFGKKRKAGPDAEAQMKRVTPEVSALEERRDYMERMLTIWIQNSERYAAMPNFLPRVQAFLRRVSGAGTIKELDAINNDFSVFATEANSFDIK
jgi:hypothetical protein